MNFKAFLRTFVQMKFTQIGKQTEIVNDLNFVRKCLKKKKRKLFKIGQMKLYIFDRI